MKIRRFFASSSADQPIRKRLINKIVTSAILTAVMELATSFYAVKHRLPFAQTEVMTANETAAEAIAEIPARGLSRQRADFEKAIDILASAARDRKSTRLKSSN